MVPLMHQSSDTRETIALNLPPILVVDHQADMWRALSKTLNRAGFLVESASSGSEALDKIKSASYSLVIADEGLPGSTGLEVLESVKKMSPQIPVIVMAANASVHNAVEAMRAGATDYILKPFSAETLEKTVANAIVRSKGNGGRAPDKENAGNARAEKQIITRDAGVQKVLAIAKGVAASDATVLIQGESGTGKELLAAYVHRHSRHPEAPYVAINCAALPDTLAESELFGHEKGSFTGAVNRKIGKFELAKQGSVVLDEISELSPPLQAKLLRVLQEKEIDRVGGTRPVPVDARVIAISNVDLKKAVSEGKFREDLYYRINVIPLTLPPLRQRKDDIPLLTEHFLNKYSRLNNRKRVRFADDAFALLLKHPWKGNIRELENTIERAVLISGSDEILVEQLILDSSEADSNLQRPFAVARGMTVREMEKKLICSTLKEVHDNRTQAAELLGISIRTLRNKLREYKDETSRQGV